jgi:cytochrome b561
MTLQASERSYKASAVALHWLIAAGIIFQIGWGWYMGTFDRTPAHDGAEQLHISVGLTILLLTFLRVAIRIFHAPPRLPDTMPGWEAMLSGVVHVLFYVLMLAIPLSGWLMESLGPRPIPFWGASWPHFPGIAVPADQRRAVHGLLETIHGSVLVWTMLGLLALHVLGAVKHQFDGHPVLWRMLPFLRKRVA